ncbi:MAG: hypothetical protein NVSMB18_08570 [Acetobacteraceae bacterium]
MAKRLKGTIDTVARDRNIIVHGVIHKRLFPNGRATPAYWTIHMGVDAGKNFPISTSAVQLVRSNIIRLEREIMAFNESHGFAGHSLDLTGVEVGWPEPI